MNSTVPQSTIFSQKRKTIVIIKEISSLCPDSTTDCRLPPNDVTFHNNFAILVNYDVIDFTDPITFFLMRNDENIFLTNNDVPHSFFSRSWGYQEQRLCSHQRWLLHVNKAAKVQFFWNVHHHCCCKLHLWTRLHMVAMTSIKTKWFILNKLILYIYAGLSLSKPDLHASFRCFMMLSVSGLALGCQTSAFKGIRKLSMSGVST